MKVMIASDIHGDAACCRKLVEAFHREKSEKLFLLGDLLDGWSGRGGRDGDSVESLLNSISDRIVCVRGNCDSRSDQKRLNFDMLDEYRIENVNGKTVFLTHGHRYNTWHLPPLEHIDILLHGHTHVPAGEPFDANGLYLNPGSLSLPRSGSARSYMVWEDKTIRWYTLDGCGYRSLTLK